MVPVDHYLIRTTFYLSLKSDKVTNTMRPCPSLSALSSFCTCRCCCHQQKLPPPLNVNCATAAMQLSMAVLDVVVNDGGSGIEPAAPMAVSSTVAAVDGGGKDGVFTTNSHNGNHHPCSSLDEDWTAGWRARHATVAVVGAIFVSICETMAPRTTAAATDKVLVPIIAAEKRWDTTTRSALRSKNKNKNKTKTKIETKSTAVAATSPPLRLKTATPVLPPLPALCKQRQQRQQYGGCGSSSSSRAVAAAAHYRRIQGVSNTQSKQS
jgi:hypothetical protein